MLSEERIQELAEQFAVRFNRVCLRILCDMGDTLRKTGELTPSQARQLQQMFTYGADVEEMTKQLARAAGSSMEEIQSLYAQAAKEEQAWTKPFYNVKGITQIPFAENTFLQNIVKAVAAVTKGNLRNMSRTTTVGIKTKKGFQPLGRFYQTTVDEAVSAVATGVSDYNSVIRQAVKDMGGGLRVQYESGYTRRLDSAMRQNIIDGVSYVAQETARQAGEEFGADGVELSAHSPCAPDHLPYQGKQYSLQEYEELQASLRRPIGEWNCRHFAYPVLLGISRPANSKAELAEMAQASERRIEMDGRTYSRYECTQLQRKLETKLRYAKEEKAVYQAAGQTELVREATEKIRILGNKYREVSKKADLPMRAERIRTAAEKGLKGLASGKAGDRSASSVIDRVSDFDYSDKKEIAMTLQNFSEEKLESKTEHAVVLSPNGKKYEISGLQSTVDITLAGEDALKDAVVIHNHPKDGELSGDCFSRADFKGYFAYGLKELYVVNHMGTYRIKSDVSMTAAEAAEVYDKAFDTVRRLAFEGADISLDYEQYEIMKVLGKECKDFIFERVK